jgi:hypothetical protein
LERERVKRAAADQRALDKANGYVKARRYDRARTQRTRELIADAKAEVCMDCNRRYPSYVMDFDHVRGVKKFSLGRAAQHHPSIAALLDEIAKCDVVCASCHRERTFGPK